MAPDWIDVSRTLYCLYGHFVLSFFFGSTQRATIPFHLFCLHFRRCIRIFLAAFGPTILNIKNAFVYDGQIKCNNFFLFNRLCVRAVQTETTKAKEK